MPLDNYGVWKARPVRYHVERRGAKTPHLTLSFRDNGSQEFEAAINIKSGDRQESRLVYWVDKEMGDHPLVERLARLHPGYHSLESEQPGPDDKRLDYIRRSLFDVQSGRILPHDIPGPNNDIIDVLEPVVKQAIDKKATVYLFGERYDSDSPGGIHNVHMNQGNIAKYARDDGVFQDGGLLFHFSDSDKWIGVFLAFASQAVHTSNETGHAISRVTWKDILPDDLVENSVAIRQAIVNPPGPGDRAQSVTLANLTDRRVSLSRWKIRNSSREEQVLPRNAALPAMTTGDFDIPNCPLSQDGDTITLLNEDGLKVAGVRYNSWQGNIQDEPIIFAR
ncbi:hypothetical protein BJX76DRAFT_200016 [Aspergillus varians]